MYWNSVEGIYWKIENVLENVLECTGIWKKNWVATLIKLHVTCENWCIIHNFTPQPYINFFVHWNLEERLVTFLDFKEKKFQYFDRKIGAKRYLQKGFECLTMLLSYSLILCSYANWTRSINSGRFSEFQKIRKSCFLAYHIIFW